MRVKKTPLSMWISWTRHANLLDEKGSSSDEAEAAPVAAAAGALVSRLAEAGPPALLATLAMVVAVLATLVFVARVDPRVGSVVARQPLALGVAACAGTLLRR